MKKPDGSGSRDMDLAAPGGVGSDRVAPGLNHTLRLVIADEAGAAPVLRAHPESVFLTKDPVKGEPIVQLQTQTRQVRIPVPASPELLRILDANPWS